MCGFLYCNQSSEVSWRYRRGEISLDEIALASGDMERGFNSQVKFLASGRRAEDLGDEVLLSNSSRGRDMLQLAKDRLSSLEFIGITERFLVSTLQLKGQRGVGSQSCFKCSLVLHLP